MPKILLVDDSAMDRRLFGGLLEKEPDFLVESVENGWAALKHLRENVPDVVVTDMQMPDMDGLELVTEVRQSYPHVPVILITGQGSEALATKALQRGAAGYVPKSQSNELLRDTVRHVLELAQAEATYERLIGCAALTQFEFVLQNDCTLIPPLLDLAQRMVGSMKICDPTGCLQLGVALEHAILNAIYHGNLELGTGQIPKNPRLATNGESSVVNDRRLESPYKDRTVSVAMRISRDEARFVVRDEGPGFDINEVTEVGLSTSLDGRSGQGLFLMWAFMDKVSFDKTGNTVTMIKRREEAQQPAERSADATFHADVGEELSQLPEIMGELAPKEGGKPYRLTKQRLIVGRDPSCDIVIKSAAVSHHHCVLYLYKGWWYVKDLQSKNGVKIKNIPVAQHLVPPGTLLSIGPHEFEVGYQPHELGAAGITPPVDPF